MAVELDGNVSMRGDTGPGVGVTILAEGGRLRLVSGNELVGDWLVSEIGISALQEGFNIKVEGEEFILRTEDDAAFAEELGVTAVSPRLARRLAVRHNPDEREIPWEPPPQISSKLAAIGFAVAGALIVLGGAYLDLAGDSSTGLGDGEGFQFWMAFLAGGILMIAASLVMSLAIRWARLVATVVLVGVVVTFGFAVSETDASASQLTAIGFIAGGIVIGVAVLVSGGVSRPDR